MLRSFPKTSLLKTIFPLAKTILPLALGLISASCSSDPRFAVHNTPYYFGQTPTDHQPDNVSFWDGGGVNGRPAIEIHLSEQRAYFFKGNTLVGISQVSTGREGHNTPPGAYKVTAKDQDHRSSQYGDYVVKGTQEVVKANVENGVDPKPPGSVFLGSPMPYFLKLRDGIGMHAGFLPGVPASHGCIRMPKSMAQNFYSHASVGTPVTITY